MNYEHFPFVVYFVYFRPPKMMSFSTALECNYATMIYTQIQLIPAMILK